MKGLVYGISPLAWATCKWLRYFWPGCLRSRLNGLRLTEIDPPPLPGDEWVRCRTLLGGICGSDLAIIMQRQPPDSFLQSFSTLPCVLGHENVAVVAEAGPAVDAAWVGKRVTVDPGLSCRVRGVEPACPACAAGRFGSCENFGAAGAGRYGLPAGSCMGYCGPLGGTWSGSFVAHESQLIEPPEAMTNRQAVLTDPLACSLHAVLRADLTRAERVLVYGGGMLALGVVWALRAVGWGGKIDVIGRHAHQGEVAEALGADDVLLLPKSNRLRFEAVAQRVGGRAIHARFGNYMLSGGYDVVFECVGRGRTIEEAVKWTRSGGQMVLLSTGHGRGTDLTGVWFGELTVLGVSGRSIEDFRGRRAQPHALAPEQMLSGVADVARLLTHTFRLDEYKAALAAAIDKRTHRSIKVAFDFDGQAQ